MNAGRPVARGGVRPADRRALATTGSTKVHDEHRWQRAGGYTFQTKPAIDFRLAEARDGLRLDTREPRLHFWLRLRARVGDGVTEQAAAFAYLSDWWVNCAPLGAHLADLGERPGLYVASLNHALWWHRPFRADQWLHVQATSPAAAAGRGFSVARVHDRQGPPRCQRDAGVPDVAARNVKDRPHCRRRARPAGGRSRCAIG